jgi:transposase
MFSMKNKYYNRSRISEAKFREVIKCFSLDIDATKTTEITHLNRNTINKIWLKTGQKMSQK